MSASLPSAVPRCIFAETFLVGMIGFGLSAFQASKEWGRWADWVAEVAKVAAFGPIGTGVDYELNMENARSGTLLCGFAAVLCGLAAWFFYARKINLGRAALTPS